METKEVKIGGTATFRGIPLRVEAATRNEEDGRTLCDGCYFFEHGMGCPDGFACMADCREDRTDVIFREVKEERPMSTEKRYIHKKICVCRSCKGTGKIVVYEKFDLLRRNPKLLACTQCGGTGRVVIQGETTINVEPFNPDRDG